MVGGLQPIAFADSVAEHPQASFRADAGVEHPHTPGGDVPGVGVRGESQSPLSLIQRHEVGVGHVDLAADFQNAGRSRR